MARKLNVKVSAVRCGNRKRQATRRKAINYEKGNWNPSGNGKVIKCNSDCKMSTGAARLRRPSRFKLGQSRRSAFTFYKYLVSHYFTVICLWLGLSLQIIICARKQYFVTILKYQKCCQNRKWSDFYLRSFIKV